MNKCRWIGAFVFTPVLLAGLVIAFLALPHGGPVRIMMAGDSTVAGYTDNPDWTEPFAFGVRGQLAQRLTEAGCRFAFVGDSPEPWNGKSGTPVLAPVNDLRASGLDKHRGYGGATFKRIATALPLWLIADDPDVIAIQAGINDVERGGENLPGNTPRFLDAIGVTARIIQPTADLIVAKVAPYDVPTPALDQLDEQIDRRFASVDLREPFLDANGAPRPDMLSNGLNHPTNAAYAAMGDLWADALIPVLRRRGACG